MQSAPRWPFYGFNEIGVPCHRSSRLTRGLLWGGLALPLGIWAANRPEARVKTTFSKGFAVLALVAIVVYVAVDFPQCVPQRY